MSDYGYGFESFGSVVGAGVGGSFQQQAVQQQTNLMTNPAFFLSNTTTSNVNALGTLLGGGQIGQYYQESQGWPTERQAFSANVSTPYPVRALRFVERLWQEVEAWHGDCLGRLALA